jgi:hypothetical protein
MLLEISNIGFTYVILIHTNNVLVFCLGKEACFDRIVQRFGRKSTFVVLGKKSQKQNWKIFLLLVIIIFAFVVVVFVFIDVEVYLY